MADFICAASSSDNTISIFNTHNYRLEQLIPLYDVSGPYRMLHHEGALYHVDSFSNTLGCVDLYSGSQRTAAIGAYPTGICIHSGRLYISCGEANSIWSIDPDTLLPADCVKAAGFPIFLGSCAEGIYAASLTGGVVACCSPELSLIRTYQTPGLPLCALCKDGVCCAGCVCDDRGMLVKYSGNVVNVQSAPPCANIAELPEGLAAGVHVWDDRLSIFSLDDLHVLHRSATSKMPDDIAVDRANGKIFISCIQAGVIDVFEPDGTRLGCIPAGNDPRALALI